ncbi:MAG TPA: carboxypeptidase-like regulatory domain-containing protein [Thermoanaerobaculia bacterium]|nr:carboxypeptidase-like regulatory domain-containing protein [Thermoanaerobaculia bacterium]
MRSVALGLMLCIACLPAFGIAWAQAPAAPVPPVDLRDDRGEPVASPLEICYRTDLRSDCVDLAAGEAFTPPAPLRSFRAEGPDHGPTLLEGEALQPGADGRLRLRIPRKALLLIGKRPAEPLDAAVYDVKAASFDKPLAAVRKVGPAGVKIPAGELLVALSAGRKAPDLHRLKVQPGETARLEYQPRDGWSLVVRSLEAKKRQAVASAVISLTSVPGYGAPSRPAGEGTTGADGLALFPGLAGRRIDADVRHTEFLPRTLQGLSAAPGGLAFHDAALEEGGRVRARIQVKGRARQGAVCRLKEARPPVPAPADWAPKVLYEGRTDREGICRTGRFPADSYLFEAALAEGGAVLKRAVVLENGVETEQDLAFSEIRVHGTVTRGGEPAPGLTVIAGELSEELGIPLELARATSGKDGTYEVILAKPGRCKFLLYSSSPPQSPPVVVRDVAVREEDESAVDFSLERAAVRGKVVDEEGKPVERALVTFYWHAAENAAYGQTDERGELEFLVEHPGEGSVEAEKKGYRKSERQDVALEDGAEAPPFVLVLVKEKHFHGKLSAVNGLPVAGGWVASLRNPYGDERIEIHYERTGAEGDFEVPPVEGRRNRLFASGPGCPLSVFDPADENGELALRCQGRPAVLDVTLTDAAGRPVPNASLILRLGGVIIPRNLLTLHLDNLGLRAETDASGRLVVPNLAPGDYDVFVADPVNEGMIEAGSHTGYLTSTRLSPLATTTLRLPVPGRPGAGGS